MKRLFLLLYIAASALLLNCTPNSHTAASFVSYNPLTFQEDSLNAAKLGVTLSKLNDEVASVNYPRQRGKVKIKNSFNTDNSQKKSHNTELKQKDVANTKAKGEAIIGNGNAPVEAKKQAIVGDGNSMEDTESLWWLWLLLGVLVTLIGVVWWYRRFG